MDDQIRADKFLQRLVKSVKPKPLTPERTRATNLTPERKETIRLNQIRQRGRNQVEKDPLYIGHREALLGAIGTSDENKRKVAASVGGKRDPVVLREIHYTPKKDRESDALRYVNYVAREVRTPATHKERLVGLARNEYRRQNRMYTESPDAIMRSLQPPYTVMAGIPSHRRVWHTPQGTEEF